MQVQPHSPPELLAAYAARPDRYDELCQRIGSVIVVRPHAAGETQAMVTGLQHQGPGCVKLLKQCIVLITWVWDYRSATRGFRKSQEAAQK